MRIVSLTAGVAALSLVMAVPASAAGSSTASTNLATVTVTIQDIAFDGDDCVRVPVPTTYTKTGSPADSISMEVEIELRQPGSNSSESLWNYFGLSSAASGSTDEMTFLICPTSFNASAGNYTATGVLRTEFDFSRTSSAAFSPFEVGVIRNQSSLGPIKMKKSAFGITLSGTATAATRTKGTVGAGGEIVISIKKPGSKKWVSGTTTYADSFGEWSASLSPQKKGTQIQVSLVKCGWCTDATRTTKTK